MKQASWNFDCKLVILNDLDRETKLSLVPLSQCSFLVLLTIEILIPGDRCRTGCHDITLQNMQFMCVRMNRLNK